MQSQVQPKAKRLFLLSNSKTLNANNTTANVQLFRITGNVRFTKIYGIVTTVISSNHTAAYWRLNDQTAQVNITLNTGTTISAASVGSVLAKFGLAGAALTLKDASAGRVSEPTTLETLEWSEFTVTAKNGANTDIEYTYTTTNTPASGVIQFFVEYEPISDDGAVAIL